MFVPSKIVDWFGLNAEIVRDLQSELAEVRKERDLLYTQVAQAQANFEWLRIRVNALEMERAALLEKAYGVKTPVPEITRQSPPNIEQFSFDDIGDEMAKKLGMPVYGSN